MNIKQAIEKIKLGCDLTQDESGQVFEQIMTGAASREDIVSFLTGLSEKGETVEEISGGARVMRDKALKVRVEKGPVLDTCGTGGSGINRFNISTAVSFVLAGGGVKVAKHGNRSASSKCGSADVLEALGVRIDADHSIMSRCLNEINIAFLFAPIFHKAMKYAAPARKEIGKRTIFNILGPLSNPASVSCQVLGVFERKLTVPLAEVLGRLGSERALVVHGEDGLDEITITGPTRVSELKDGAVRTYDIGPSDFGVEKAGIEEITGGSARDNAAIVKAVLSGERGPRRDIVLINSSAGFLAAGRTADLKEGVRLAQDSIDSGKALETLNALVEMTGKAGGGKACS
ncbi:MAG: anthranilate phosphoribosyltransferase [Candidatus Omnitrophica bacterium]|nr:anthranilate phosphoribosyltransferase [Candidatus Omnitrophota bacterium]